MWWKTLDQQAGELTRHFKSSPRFIHPTADVAPTATLMGDVYVGARAKICHGAYIQGPVWIGDDCLVGNLAMIRGPLRLGDGSRIGFATEIKNAVIEENVSIGPQCFIADSKIEAGAYLGAQVRTSNHRLDRQTIRAMADGELVDTGLEKLGALIGARASLGIQVIVLPGRTIAPDTLFEPRITVAKNLPSGRYRLMQQTVALHDQTTGH
ncbi:acetyltransferase [Pseudoxanthomonas sp. UTMC 1351]|uniref:DapH/DapD/GlmU-related protein n=1 Tax=Pseudoxanthomonas sp. UTMC 1351 TaxID=2695853 RepID=UPI0034CFCDF9